MTTIRCTFACITLFVGLAASGPFMLEAKERLPATKRENESAGRLREGTKLTDVLGKMESVGDQATFTPAEGTESYRLLQNLALERINQILSDNREKSQWEVSGVVTEFRGSNYLLVTKAIIKSNNGSAAEAASPSPRKPSR